MPFLSICIPTFNRGYYLNELLEELFLQINDLDYEIEVCVSDNASCDNTQEILSKWSIKFSNFVYSFNKTNIGADLNYQKVVDLASGKYIWFFGSDDLPEKNALKNLCDIISSKSSLGIFVFNRNDYDINMKYLYSRYWLKKNIVECEFQFNDVLRLEKYFENSLSLGAVFSYLSSIVFARNIWEKDNELSNFNNTAYSHAYLLVKSIFDSRNGNLTFLYSSNHFVKNRTNNDSFLSTPKNRLLLDYYGYKKISASINLPSSLKKSFLQILSKEHNVKELSNSLTFYKLSFEEFKILTNNIYSFEDYNFLYTRYKLRYFFIIFVFMNLAVRKLLYKIKIA